MKSRGASFLYKNSLSLSFLLLFIASLGGQAYTGWREHNDFLAGHRQLPTGFWDYLRSGHFLQSTFENWESEFFQMALFVILTVFLRQIGSSESKEVDAEIVDGSQLQPKPDSPWPVRKGGLWLALYKHSLSIALILLFIFSFAVHAWGSWRDHREQQLLEGRPAEGFGEYLTSTKLWFESFQNWQSEFLSVFAIIFLSIYLRQIGSPQSKPVNAPHMETDTES